MSDDERTTGQPRPPAAMPEGAGGAAGDTSYDARLKANLEAKRGGIALRDGAVIKRFYKTVAIAPVDGAAGQAPGVVNDFVVTLDDRPLNTPGRRKVAVADASLADALADEWRAQVDIIKPETMPLTRLVNSALDGVASNLAAVRADIVMFAGSDLLCYRADAPIELVEAQTDGWDPVLRWTEATHGATWATTTGVMPITQPTDATTAVARAVALTPALPLTALHVITTLTGSAVLALAVGHARITADEAWRLAHLDEDWQISQWGEDGEAAARRAKRWVDMQAAAKILGTFPSA